MDTAMTVDELRAYFRRIGVATVLDTHSAPTLKTLETVVAGHNRNIPFETLDPVLGRPVADLRTGTLVEKLVHRHRGGYCYEQNGLIGGALLALGYDVTALTGRVVWLQPDGACPTARTHLALAVNIPSTDESYLVDVGFGGQTLSSPIRLDRETPQHTRHERHRLISMPDGWRRLEAEIRGSWQPLYVLGPDAQQRIDLEVDSWYVSTHPESDFVRNLSAALAVFWRRGTQVHRRHPARSRPVRSQPRHHDLRFPDARRFGQRGPGAVARRTGRRGTDALPRDEPARPAARRRTARARPGVGGFDADRRHRRSLPGRPGSGRRRLHPRQRSTGLRHRGTQ
ncbi:arylamine N-acetyltransferase [Micromonospora sp. KC606]|uniref:arylamine N-acetyltransferase family protein n=1 Tax=Micromonospora sp. KC606 TaxID=2530379 RepID=UPI0010443194|nr:arylamine N-acetyltransferase [Micromonospora sp. KC606]TDC82861.1 arylamine N-acetyltransferase [Micromonospora sp. KC606]